MWMSVHASSRIRLPFRLIDPNTVSSSFRPPYRQERRRRKGKPSKRGAADDRYRGCAAFRVESTPVVI